VRERKRRREEEIKTGNERERVCVADRASAHNLNSSCRSTISPRPNPETFPTLHPKPHTKKTHLTLRSPAGGKTVAAVEQIRHIYDSKGQIPNMLALANIADI
jgi:hypothetical protein